MKNAGNQRSGQIETRRLKIKSMVRQKDKVVFVVEQSLFTPDRSVRPRMLLVKCGKKGHYKKCRKGKTGKQGTTGKPRQVQVHGLQALLTGVSADQTSARDPAQDYHMMFGPHVPQDDQHTMFHHIQTFHVKSINETSSKHIKPLWLSTASGGPIYQVECEIDTGAECNVVPLYLHKILIWRQDSYPYLSTDIRIWRISCSKCGKKGHYKKCRKGKTGKQGTTGKPRQVQVHGLQALLTGVSADQTSARDPAQDYHMMFGPHVPQDDQHTMFHHIQTFHVKSINETSSKHIKPLWLSTASGGPIYQVECEIDTGAECNVVPLYLHKILIWRQDSYPYLSTDIRIWRISCSKPRSVHYCDSYW